MAGSKMRVIAGGLLVCALAAGWALGFGGCDGNYPDGVETDASEVRSVTLSGSNYEVVDFEDDLYELPMDSTEVHVREDESREFVSRDKDTLWVSEDTAERIGVE